jgi:hypothetical protein
VVVAMLERGLLMKTDIGTALKRDNCASNYSYCMLRIAVFFIRFTLGNQLPGSVMMHSSTQNNL